MEVGKFIETRSRQMERINEVEIIEKEMGVRSNRRTKLSKFYGRLSENERIEVHKAQGELMRRHRAAYKDKLSMEGYAYMMLIIALDRHEKMEHIERQRNPSPADLENAQELRVQRFKSDRRMQKKSPLRDKVELRYIKLIELLRGAGISWRKIPEYLKKFHKIEISYGYARQIYLEGRKADDK